MATYSDGFIYKPQTRKGPVFIAPFNAGTAPTITGSDGKVYTAKRGDQAGGVFEGHHGFQWVFDNDVIGLNDATINYGDQSGKIGAGRMSYRGGDLGGWQESSKGAIGDTSEMMGGSIPPGMAPGNIGYGAFPAYLGGQFPSPFLINPVPYKYTDPFEFSKKWGDLSRDEVTKNSAKAKELALDQLNTELQGLQAFTPGATALKRETIAGDNTFNQQQRTQQLAAAMPQLRGQFEGLEGDLEAQRGRAATYASGRAPDEITDRSLELTLRSRAADQSRASGFGGMAADTVSDRLSAETRLALAQYGENLTGQNVGARSALINQRAALELAPTSYSDAGSQIRVVPSVSGAGLAQGNLSQLNQLSMLAASQAFQGETQQQQYITNQEYDRQVRNTGTQNEFAMGKFAYDVGYAGTLAGAAQTDINTQLGLAQQAAANEASMGAQNDAQTGNTVGSIAAGVGAIVSAIPSVIDSLSGTGGSQGYTGSGAVEVGGVGYEPGSNYGAGDNTIYVPAGQPVPSGYRPQRRTPNGGTIAAPIRGGSTGSSDESYNDGQSDSDFSSPDESPPPSSDPTGEGEFDPEDIPPGAVQDPDTGTVYYPDDYPEGYPGDSEDSGEELSQEGEFAFNRSGRLGAAKLSDAQAQKFQEDTGLGLDPAELPYLSYDGKSVLSDAGIHYQSSKIANTNIGVDSSGKNLWGDPTKMELTDPQVGSDYVNSFIETFKPLSAFQTKDINALDSIAKTAGNAALIQKLTNQWKAGDTKGFINTIAKAFKKPIINSITKDPRSRQGLNTAFSAYNLFQNWDRMSDGQRGLGLASVGLQGFHYATGESLANKPLVGATFDSSGKQITPELTVGQSLQLFQQGYNVYSMVDNWDNLSDIQKISQGTNNVLGMAQVGKQFGLLGSGTGGSAVNVTAAQLASQGFTAAPAYGVGAVTAQAGTALPAGYTGVASLPNGSIVAVPQANSATAAVGTSTLQAVAGGAAIAAGAYQVYQGWGTGGKAGAINGAVGGLAISSGLMALGYTNPYLLGAVAAISIAGNVMKTGKHVDQVARDSVRGVFQKSGLISDDYQVTLANGSQVDLGVDGRGGRHGSNSDLHSYDVDYMNDLDYASSMGGITLSRLLSGGTAKNIDQMGGQLGNAAIADIGFGQQMTEDNFNKMAANQRAFFAQSGIKSKEDATQLINLAEAEGRLSANDAVTSRQAVNMMFDKDGFQLANKLLAGRNRGLEVAPESSTKDTTQVVTKEPQYDSSLIKNPDAGFNDPAVAAAQSNVNNYGKPFNSRPSTSNFRLSKEEIRNRNASRYSPGGMAAGG